MHEDSIRYYVRALAMNPKADNAWQYLRISLRYDGESKVFLNSSEIQCIHISYRCFYLAAVLLGMTCLKLVILEILMFYRRSSHYNMFICVSI
jgi:peroxin-5